MEQEESNRYKWLKWFIVFILFFIGLFCYMKDYGYADSVPLEQEYSFQCYECRSPWGRNHKQSASRDQKNMWQEAYDNHHFHAVRTYNDAYNRVWWLPELTWRQVGRDAWIAACATAGTSTPTSALVVVFSTLLSSYGLHCLDEWDYIQDKLSWSEYHFSQCKYYADLLQNS